jgi:superfamily II DNA/RNA helicase
VPPTFADLGVPEDLCRALTAADIHEPFAVQASALPDALAGHDVCGRAPTGSGKTLAFGIAMVARVHQAESGHPTGLVLVPTRELAEQVKQAMVPVARERRLHVLAVYGGTALSAQIRSLSRGATIVVATPGRLQDLVTRGAVSLDAVQVVVLDEADRMADMGFLPQVKKLLDLTPASRQTMLWSATLDGDVDTLIRRYQTDPRRIELAADESVADLTHAFWNVAKDAKPAMAAELVRRHGSGIVFVRTRHGVDHVVKQLRKAGLETAAIHGNRTQSQRERSLDAFRAGDVAGLVATDVAARGIHVDDVGVVIHWDPVDSHKDYVHRSGRTGRAGARGTVVSLVTSEARAKTIVLQRALGMPVGIDQPESDVATAAARSVPTPGPKHETPATVARGGEPATPAGPGHASRPNRAARRAHLQPSAARGPSGRNRARIEQPPRRLQPKRSR